MLRKEYIAIIEESQKNYHSLGCLPCPAFNGELVYFNKYGFNHIIRKGRAVRSWEEQAARFRLIPLAVEIIKRETRTWGFRSTKRPGSTAHFYTLKGKIGTERVRVIIRRKNGGTLHFFSVMLE